MKKPLLRDQIGKRCRINRKITTRIATFPKGTEFTIMSHHQGRYDLARPGGSSIRRVFPVWIEVIEEVEIIGTCESCGLKIYEGEKYNVDRDGIRWHVECPRDHA